jgi:hypothetical protein
MLFSFALVFKRETRFCGYERERQALISVNYTMKLVERWLNLFEHRCRDEYFF